MDWMLMMEFWCGWKVRIFIFSQLETPISHSAAANFFFTLSTCGHDLSVLGPPNIIIMTLCSALLLLTICSACRKKNMKCLHTRWTWTNLQAAAAFYFTSPVGTSFLLTGNLSDLDINDYSRGEKRDRNKNRSVNSNPRLLPSLQAVKHRWYLVGTLGKNFFGQAKKRNALDQDRLVGHSTPNWDINN